MTGPRASGRQAATSDQQCCICRPPNMNPEDYEIRVQVDFENRLLRPLGISGVKEEDTKSEVLLFARDKCQPNCATTGCLKCRLRKLYQDLAGAPKGSVAFKPNDEYLYCLRFDQQPVTALLSLTPREQNVEVKELGLLAYWFATWFQRAKFAHPEGGAAAMVPQTPSAVVAEAAASAAMDEIVGGGRASRHDDVDTCATSDDRQTSTTGTTGRFQRITMDQQLSQLTSQNSTSRYLPNMRIIYQVRKEKMTITLSKPYQLTRELEVMLVCRKDVEPKVQTAILRPGVSQASCELTTSRDTPYTLMVRLKDQGNPVELLDLITEHKVLRVQESRLAPKFMNFLMERRVDQRATFVLHVTFDERIIEVDTKWLGEFFLDVDIENQTLSIGTVRGHERKAYRVERLAATGLDDVLNANKVLVYEGGVDQGTLFTRETIPIQKMSDYLITVLDPDAGTVLPTTVLSFQKTSLFVKEMTGSDVKLHVTVQRQLAAGTPVEAKNSSNNLTAIDPQQQLMMTTESHMPVVRRCQQDGAFHCPIREGCMKYRILHNAGSRRGRAASRCSAALIAASAAAATDAAVAAADASCYSSGGVSCGATSWDDSGLGRNQNSLSENQESAAYSQQRLWRLEQQQQQQQQQDYNVNLDVDLPNQQARLLPGDGVSGSNYQDSGCCYLIVEESLTGGGSRSVPCKLGQTFSVRHWFKYTVKAIDERSVTPLFTFRLTDTEVTDIRPCNPMVHLSKNATD